MRKGWKSIKNVKTQFTFDFIIFALRKYSPLKKTGQNRRNITPGFGNLKGAIRYDYKRKQIYK